MSVNNPRFQHCSRAAYELPHLLLKLGDDTFPDPLSQDQRDIADAAKSHAFNYLETILGGIQSIGRLMSSACDNGAEPDPHDISNLGNLLGHLAVQAEFLLDTDANMTSILRSDDAKQAAGTSVPKRSRGG